jgi:hypothetical protein
MCKLFHFRILRNLLDSEKEEREYINAEYGIEYEDEDIKCYKIYLEY